MPLMLTPKIETELRALILAMLAEKRSRESIGPADVARRFRGEAWKGWMDTVKEVAHRLQVEGAIVTTRHGKPTDAWPWRGVIRLRAPSAAP